jgi:hypothetical protein
MYGLHTVGTVIGGSCGLAAVNKLPLDISLGLYNIPFLASTVPLVVIQGLLASGVYFRTILDSLLFFRKRKPNEQTNAQVIAEYCHEIVCYNVDVLSLLLSAIPFGVAGLGVFVYNVSKYSV